MLSFFAQERDTFVDAALAGAGLPIVRVIAQSGYRPEEISKAVEQYLR